MPLDQVGTTDVGTGARLSQPRAGWLRRAAWGVCLLWLTGHVAALFAVPSHSGLPEWSSLEALVGARVAVIARLAFVACLGSLSWRWARQRLQLEGDVARLWRVGASLTLAFLVLHLLHMGGVFHVADLVPSQRQAELNDRLAASLSSTRWGVPWLAFAYLTGSIAAGILCGVEVWLVSDNGGASKQSWRKQRTWRFLSICVGIIVGGASLRALLYFATGAQLWN